MEQFLYTSEGKQSLDGVIAIYGDTVHYHSYMKDEECLSSAKPMTFDALKVIFKSTQNDGKVFDYQFRDIIPKKVIYYSSDELFVAWESPSQTKTIIFQDDKKIQSGVYPIPRLLWVLRGLQLSVFALKRSIKNFDDPVFQAPFMNISSRGAVCMGSAKFKSSSNYYEDIIEKVELAFFNSTFTHAQTNIINKVNYGDFMNSIHNSKSFPISSLVKINYTVKNCIHGK